MPAPVQDEVLRQLDALVLEGARLIAGYREQESGQRYSKEPRAPLYSFITTVAAQVSRIAGRDSEYYRQLIQPPADNADIGWNPQVIESSLGAVQALRVAVASGQLESLASRVRSAVHDDMLQQAVELLGAGYHVASMVLVGGVFENHLRNLCAARGLAPRAQLGGYNDALRDVLYPQVTWRRIQAITDLRNNAAHGHVQLVLVPEVDDALRFVQRFIADFVT
jgi:hypothetical protein